MSDIEPVSIATTHWAERVNGGGERVGWALGRCFDAPLFVGERDESIEPDDVDVHHLFEDHAAKRLIDLSGVARMLGHQAGWGTAHTLREYDVLVSSGNECLAYVPAEDQPWIHYVHHTSRYATDRLSEIESKHSDRLMPSLIRKAEYLQRWTERQIYGSYARKPDLLVANSELIARRIKKYWGISESDIRVVYPPVPTHEFSPNDRETGNYYVTLSRLDWHKNIGEIVRAFNETGHRLIVAGDGPEREDLEALAAENVEFAGYVSESEKRELLAGAKAFVFAAQAEDFGIAPVEAMAAGTPVIGVNEGFTQYQVQEEKSGILFDRSGSNLADSIRAFDADGVSWPDTEIAEFADKWFSPERFEAEMHDIVNEAIHKAQISPAWDRAGESEQTEQAERSGIKVQYRD